MQRANWEEWNGGVSLCLCETEETCTVSVPSSRLPHKSQPSVFPGRGSHDALDQQALGDLSSGSEEDRVCLGKEALPLSLVKKEPPVFWNCRNIHRHLHVNAGWCALLSVESFNSLSIAVHCAGPWGGAESARVTFGNWDGEERGCKER